MFFCLQVHLEIEPEKLASKGFDELKVSNALRYEVLTEILVSLGLSCELNHSPVPSPVHLLAISEVRPTVLVCNIEANTHRPCSGTFFDVRHLISITLVCVIFQLYR